jgi:flagellar biosynthesis/type III secretory pathway protein FliH
MPSGLEKFLIDALEYRQRKILEEGIAKGIVRGLEEGIVRGREEGITKGLEEGIVRGREEGISKGLEEGITKGREEGIEEGKIEATILSILIVLKNRFDLVPKELQDRLFTKTDLTYLNSLIATASTCSSIDEFIKLSNLSRK